MKKVLVFVLILAIAVVTPTILVAAGSGAAQKQAIESAPDAELQTERARQNRRALPIDTGRTRVAENVGTIQYDDGVANVLPSTNSYMHGNHFNSNNGNPLTASGSITGISFYMVSVGGTAAFVSIFDQLNTGAGTANLITSASQTGLAAGFNTKAIGPINYVGNSFLAGVWYFNTDVPGLGTGTTAGQGVHGMRINDIVGTDYVPSTTYNALFRASGDVILVPVELMEFTVEGN